MSSFSEGINCSVFIQCVLYSYNGILYSKGNEYLQLYAMIGMGLTSLLMSERSQTQIHTV